jgi:hypothetical protein
MGNVSTLNVTISRLWALPGKGMQGSKSIVLSGSGGSDDLRHPDGRRNKRKSINIVLRMIFIYVSVKDLEIPHPEFSGFGMTVLFIEIVGEEAIHTCEPPPLQHFTS